MAVRGRVRYGPSTKASTVCTLNPGTTVQVLRAAEGQDGWYEIQFPRQGHAWMHRKVLAPTDNPTTFRVTVDKARVRADSRIQGELVAQLDLNETVEWVGSEIDGKWIGRSVGQWLAIYPPSAVAYTHQSVLKLSQDDLARLDNNILAGHALEKTWRDAQTQYRSFRKVLETDRQKGLALDWASLQGQFSKSWTVIPRLARVY